MGVLNDIIKLIDTVQSQDDLQVISKAMTARWRILQGVTAQKTVADKGLVSGQPVSFMHAGKRIYGVVKTVNVKTCSVDVPSGVPGVSRAWRVSPQLLQKEDKLPEVKKRSESEIMNDILSCYGDLSPENLSADGERSHADTFRRSRELHTQLDACFKELGRVVTEAAAYDWAHEHPDPMIRRHLVEMPKVP